MKIILDVKSDSANSYCENVEFAVSAAYNENQVTLELSNPDRTITVNRSDLIKALKVFEVD